MLPPDTNHNVQPIDEQIASLSAEQAARALYLFYDLMPANTWENDSKPSMARIERLSEQLQELATDDVKTLVDTLLSDKSPGVREAICKTNLKRLAADDRLRPYIEQAISVAAKPHMLIDPVTIGAVLLILAALSAKVDIKVSDKETHVKIEGRAPELLTALKDLIKELPQGLLKGLSG